MTLRTGVEEAVAFTEERHPGLSRLISGCLVGWTDANDEFIVIPPIMYQVLVVSVGKYIDEH